MRNYIEISNLSFSYGNAFRIKDLNLELSKGEKVALIGNNGSGKSTLMGLICNLYRPIKGDYYFNNTKVTSDFFELRREMGIVMSNATYVEYFTVWEYLMFVLKMFDLDPDNAKKKIQSILDRLNLKKCVNKKINTLSSGEKIKVRITASLLHNPKILIYDEPFTYLDLNSIQEVKKIILENDDITLLLASNNLHECIDICDKFIVMNTGKVVAEYYAANYNSSVNLENAIKNEVIHENIISSPIEWI